VQKGKELAVEDGVLMPLLLRCAAVEGLKIGAPCSAPPPVAIQLGLTLVCSFIALHVEPYEGRNADSLRRDLEYASKAYGEHPAMQKDQGRLVYYLYDSYREPATEWAKLFAPYAPHTVRGTSLDGLFICLLLDNAHLQYAVDAHCDGYYTYFASPISWGANPRNWDAAHRFAAQHSLIFAPSVGPGYIDTRVHRAPLHQPWLI
jgi:hypothetical protein